VVATIEDVARLAGVSVATVSRALRGLPNVAPSTRQKVQLAARELQYVADPHASRLAARRSATIGVVVPMLGQWYYAQLFSGAEGALVAAGYDILPLVVGGEQIRQRFLASQPFRKRVDGLVVADVSFTEEEFEQLSRAGMPVITLGLVSPGLSSICIDNRRAARAATEHLLALGHRRIGVLSALPDDPFRFVTPAQREEGIREALADAGLSLADDLVVAGNFSFQGGAEGMRQLLDRPDPPTAVFALSDEMAVGGMGVARDRGFDVPRDLSVVGFDDHDVSAYLGLTTVRQDVVAQGELAVQRLLAVIADPDRPARHETFPTQLVVRDSTAAPVRVDA
jgi:LacI family repressor for deo operon, udp, cdd, tsx, nupC, and nupG